MDVASVGRGIRRLRPAGTGSRAPSIRPGAAPGRLRLRTLVLIRWVAILGQAFTVFLVHYSLGFKLPLGPLLAAIGVSALLNLPLGFAGTASFWLSERNAALLLGYDVLQLTFLLALTGGLQNPFALLLLMPVTLSAATLSLGTTVALCLIAINAVTLLALAPTPLPWADPGFALPKLYVFALWIAFVLGTCLIAAYAWRVSEESRRLSDALAATQMALAREQELAALGGLAAAAAHELGSPLTTIAVIAKDMADALPPGGELREDARELLTQTQRCREILAQLGKRRRDDGHEPFTEAPMGDLLETLAAEYGRPGAPGVEVTVAVEGEEEEPVIRLTPELRHALGNLIDNAVSFAASLVVLRLELDRDAIILRVQDDGPGFAPEVLESLGAPYFSTRRESGGLGLGVFIARTLLARTGAEVVFDNRAVGAQVTIAWGRRDLEALRGDKKQ